MQHTLVASPQYNSGNAQVSCDYTTTYTTNDKLMTIIGELEKRSKSPSDSVKIELKLYNLADDLEKKARNLLKKITNVLPEFDIHDEKHSEKVVFNIEKLLADNVKKLTTYELFLLQLSSFFMIVQWLRQIGNLMY